MAFGVSGVSVTYGATVALDAVDLEAVDGAVTMVVGGDGAGKTTLLRTLVGLVHPERGTVRRPRKEQVGYLPTGAGSWPHLTVDENVSFVGGSFGLTGASLASRASDLLAAAGLDRARDRLASQLSGGMRNKLGFCLAMLADPALLVLDEPTTGVDPVSRVDLWRLISEAAAGGTAVVMATTYMDEAERAGTVTVLHEGRTLLAGPPDAVIGSLGGQITSTPAPTNRALAWRSGPGYREWWPDGAPAGAHVLTPDLEDLAVVAELTTEDRR